MKKTVFISYRRTNISWALALSQSLTGNGLELTNRIHIFGASGSGVTTLGLWLAKQLGGKLLDTDSYYWEDTDPPFRIKKIRKIAWK